MKFYSKGAMFGLDARIALAIFGALSVISGAALYSAIQDSKATSIYVTLTEVEKALESLLLDTGGFTITGSDPFFILNAGDLVENKTSRSGWSGPYYSGYKSVNLNPNFIYNSEYTLKVHLDRLTFSNCSSGSVNTTTGKDYIEISQNSGTSSSNCQSDVSFLKVIHDKFDSDGDYDSGKMLIGVNSSDATKGVLLYQLSDKLIPR
jgi:type II secretory pathway pseudopilin PulG